MYNTIQVPLTVRFGKSLSSKILSGTASQDVGITLVSTCVGIAAVAALARYRYFKTRRWIPTEMSTLAATTSFLLKKHGLYFRIIHCKDVSNLLAHREHELKIPQSNLKHTHTNDAEAV